MAERMSDGRVMKYLWLRDAQKRPVACIAYSAKREDPKVQVGFSVCHNRDETHKERGREIARARHDKFQMKFESSGKNAEEIRNDVLSFLRQQDAPNAELQKTLIRLRKML